MRRVFLGHIYIRQSGLFNYEVIANHFAYSRFYMHLVGRNLDISVREQ